MQLEPKEQRTRGAGSLNGYPGGDVDQIEALGGMLKVKGNQTTSH